MSALGRAAASGVRWAALGQLLRQGVLLGALVAITRLIGPERYGIVSMALAVIGFVELFRDLGTSASIVQRREADAELLASTFWLNLAFGALCAGAVVLCAPLAAAFFRTPEVAPVLRGLSLGFLLSSLGLVPLALFQRDLAFRTLALIETLAAIGGAVAGVGMALAGLGVWSIVGQSLVMAGLTSALAWACTRWRPSWRLSGVALVAFREFGAGLVGFNLVNYFARNADYLLIGRYLGAASLGVYTLAYRLILLPQQNLALAVSRVLFPVLARLDDVAQFRRAYLRLATLLATIATPLYVGLFALREPLLRLCFGEEWLPAAPILAVLAPVGLFQVLSGTVGLIYQARGRTDLLLRWGLGAGALTVAGFALGLPWGALGVAIAYALTMLILAYPVFAIPFRLIGLPVLSFARALLPACACGAGMLAALAALAPLARPLSDALTLIVGGAAGLGVYLALSWLLNRAALLELRRALVLY